MADETRHSQALESPETNLQTFVRGLHEAYAASEAVDNFDLRSEDEASAQKWKGLLERQRVAFGELHEICRRVPVHDLMYEE